MRKKINIFYTTCGNIIDSKKLARTLLSGNKAFCINILKNVESLYLDKGRIKSSSETILIIKTTMNKSHIENFIKNQHPYEIPFITQIVIKDVNDEYLNWASKN